MPGWRWLVWAPTHYEPDFEQGLGDPRTLIAGHVDREHVPFADGAPSRHRPLARCSVDAVLGVVAPE